MLTLKKELATAKVQFPTGNVSIQACAIDWENGMWVCHGGVAAQ